MDKPPDTQRRALGKGLSALLPSSRGAVAGMRIQPVTPTHLLLDQIDPNPVQPRTIFDPARLQELAASIEANGIIQPLIVRRKGERFELIAGERRLRAAKQAGLTEVPVVVQDHADNRLLELALVENIQREDLNPIETAHALDRLVRELSLSHEEIGRRTGKDRSTIANFIRLLKLPESVQLLVAEHRLSMGHARALLGLPSPEEQKRVADNAVSEGYSVRQLERVVQLATQHREPGGGSPDQKSSSTTTDPNVAAAVRELESVLGTRVRVVEKSDKHGRIEIEYYSQEELHRLYDLLLTVVHR